MSDGSLLLAGDSGVARAVELLRAGGLVAVPTETVYGLAADASSSAAVKRIFAAKGRPADHPLIVHLADAAYLDRWARDVPAVAHALAAACWPGPLTLVLRRTDDVPDAVTGGLDTVGIRVPSHPVIAEVLRRFDGGLAAPSANRFGRVSPTTAAHVVQELGDRLDQHRDAVLDGGACAVGVESTIVDCTGQVLVILRPGAVSAERIEEVTGVPVQRVATGPVRAPGMLAAHYAPTAVVQVVNDRGSLETALQLHLQGARYGTIGVLGPEGIDLPPGVVRLEAPGPYTASLLAPVLYARLREADVLRLDMLLVVVPSEDALTPAVLDRLSRAATGSLAGAGDGA